MKTVVIFLCLVSAVFIAHTQNVNEYTKTNPAALNIPDAQATSTGDIAAYINNHFKTDDEKLRAIYIWIITHIQYSGDSIHRIILMEDREQLVTFAMRRKKGVCENFAAIFDDLCRKCGLKSFIVEGYTKQNNSLDKTSHAWNIVFAGNKWWPCDPTWDAGQPDYTYFKVSPEVFIKTHWPFDPLFQLLNYPITYKEFYNGNAYTKNSTAYFNYMDSINEYEKSSPVKKYVSASFRIQNNGAPYKLIRDKLSQLRLEAELIYQDKDSALYNNAVADYNNAINNFNAFLTYRNNQFKPQKTDAEIQSLFSEIENRIDSARANLKEINQSKAILTLDTGDIEYALNNLLNHLNEQKTFLKNYTGKTK